MSRLSDRGRPATQPSVRQRLEAFVRMCRVPEGVTLDALADRFPPQACLDAGRCYPPEKVVEDAFNVYVTAADALRRGGESQRAAVRGCSVDLLVLLVQQAFALAQRVELRGRLRVEQTREIEVIQQRLRVSFGRALSLREQARRVLAMMGTGDREYLDEVRLAATVTDGGGSVAPAMLALAKIGRRLLADPSEKGVQRARLLGLDDAYLETLEALGAELKGDQEDLASLSDAAQAPDNPLYAEAGLTVHLMMHIIEVFAAAHEIDPAVPLLKPVHTQRMVRRMSRLPAPSGTMPAVRVERLTPVDAKIDFHGGLGKKAR
jgi:hypothetical protein